MDDVERYRKLREQEAREFTTPDSVADLMVMGGIPGGLVDKALARWDAWRDELRRGGPIGAQERFLFLTYALAEAVPGRYDGAAVRARLLDEAEPLLTAPYLRDQLLALKARDRIRDGDLPSAESLLSRCEPVSDDLFADSDVRTSRALLALARRRPPDALEHVGREPGDLPIARPSQPLLDVLRAAAYDAAHDDERADRALARALTLYGRDFVAAVRERYADLDLCGAAWGRTSAALAPTPASFPEVPSPPSLAFTWPFLIGYPALLAAIFVDEDATTDDGYSLSKFFFVFGAAWIAVGALVSWSARHVISASQSPERAGEPAVARVRAIRESFELLGVPQLEMDLDVYRGDEPPYPVTARVGVMELHFPVVTKLREVHVAVDPTDPTRVQVVLPFQA